MSLWLGRRLPGGMDAAIGMNKGGTVEVAGIKVTMVHADHSAGDWNPGGETTLYLGDPIGFILEFETGSGSMPPATPTCTATCATSASCTPAGAPADRRALHDGAARGTIAAELLGVQHIIPIHYGTFPILAGTPDQLRAEPPRARVPGRTGPCPEPGGTVS